MPVTAVPVIGNDSDETEQPVTLAELDASIEDSPEVPEDEIAVRYHSDEALLAAIQQRRNGRAGN